MSIFLISLLNVHEQTITDFVYKDIYQYLINTYPVFCVQQHTGIEEFWKALLKFENTIHVYNDYFSHHEPASNCFRHPDHASMFFCQAIGHPTTTPSYKNSPPHRL